jgi:hypothetical protein
LLEQKKTARLGKHKIVLALWFPVLIGVRVLLGFAVQDAWVGTRRDVDHLCDILPDAQIHDFAKVSPANKFLAQLLVPKKVLLHQRHR